MMSQMHVKDINWPVLHTVESVCKKIQKIEYATTKVIRNTTFLNVQYYFKNKYRPLSQRPIFVDWTLQGSRNGEEIILSLQVKTHNQAGAGNTRSSPACDVGNLKVYSLKTVNWQFQYLLPQKVQLDSLFQKHLAPNHFQQLLL